MAQEKTCKKIDEQAQKFIVSYQEDVKRMTQEEKETEIDKIELRLKNIWTPGKAAMTALDVVLEAIPVIAFIPTAITMSADNYGDHAKQIDKDEDGECYSGLGGVIYPLICMCFGVEKSFMPSTQDSFNDTFPSYTEIKELLMKLAVLQASIKR